MRKTCDMDPMICDTWKFGAKAENSNPMVVATYVSRMLIPMNVKYAEADACDVNSRFEGGYRPLTRPSST